MNWKNLLYSIGITLALAGCDSFQEDVAPIGEQELELKKGITALPNTSLFIDLKKTIHTSSVVKFHIGTNPQRGSVTISDQAILEYKPHSDFMDGSDSFTLDMLNSNDDLVDTDTLFVTMGNSADSLPCFNGALSDYVSTTPSQPVAISPLVNDGYCAEDISGVEVNILEGPANGELKQVVTQLQNVFSYEYTPDVDFIGQDEFTYDLNITSVEGEEYYSMAKVYIDVVKADSNLCEPLFYPTYFINEDSGMYHYIDLFYLDPLTCGGYINEVTLEVLNVYSGSAEVYDNHTIKYFPGTDSIDIVDYKIHFPDYSVIGNLTIIHDYQVVPDDTTSCLEANDDSYELYIIQDSIGSESVPYILNLAANDVLCDLNNYEIRLLTNPDVGVATINSNQNLEYYASEEFAGVMTFDMVYEICSNALCDSAYVYLSVENE